MAPDRPNPIRPGSPCPNCGGTTFESFAFAMGEMETPNGPRSFSFELARCTACNQRLRGKDSRWKRMSEAEFERAVTADREATDRVRQHLRPPTPIPRTQGE